ncbi:MAG: metalloregulator ArsR/SmtB family transcription factor [Rhizomicrobium sp.]|jgi:DNA-binding transcriptional ArsR family regulator
MSMDAVFKALADATRRQLLDRLFARNGQTLGALCKEMEMTRQAVTKHLALLEAANLVATQKRGREKLHYLNPVPINEIAERWIGKYERHRVRALADLKKNLEGKSDG